MSKFLIRIIAACLVPCLLADPAFAAIISNPLTPRSARLRGEGTLFAIQALSPAALPFLEGSLNRNQSAAFEGQVSAEKTLTGANSVIYWALSAAGVDHKQAALWGARLHFLEIGALVWIARLPWPVRLLHLLHPILPFYPLGWTAASLIGMACVVTGLALLETPLMRRALGRSEEQGISAVHQSFLGAFLAHSTLLFYVPLALPAVIPLSTQMLVIIGVYAALVHWRKDSLFWWGNNSQRWSTIAVTNTWAMSAYLTAVLVALLAVLGTMIPILPALGLFFGFKLAFMFAIPFHEGGHLQAGGEFGPLTRRKALRLTISTFNNRPFRWAVLFGTEALYAAAKVGADSPEQLVQVALNGPTATAALAAAGFGIAVLGGAISLSLGLFILALGYVVFFGTFFLMSGKHIILLSSLFNLDWEMMADAKKPPEPPMDEERIYQAVIQYLESPSVDPQLQATAFGEMARFADDPLEALTEAVGQRVTRPDAFHVQFPNADALIAASLQAPAPSMVTPDRMKKNGKLRSSA